MGTVACQVSYGVVASVIFLVSKMDHSKFGVMWEREGLHAGIPTSDYEYFPLEIG